MQFVIFPGFNLYLSSLVETRIVRVRRCYSGAFSFHVNDFDWCFTNYNQIIMRLLYVNGTITLRRGIACVTELAMTLEVRGLSLTLTISWKKACFSLPT